MQLQLPLDTPVATKLTEMECHITAMNESMGKVRRAIFAEVGELKKMVVTLQQENEKLRSEIHAIQPRSPKTQFLPALFEWDVFPAHRAR